MADDDQPGDWRPSIHRMIAVSTHRSDSAARGARAWSELR
jgi:hypothetical protein